MSTTHTTDYAQATTTPTETLTNGARKSAGHIAFAAVGAPDAFELYEQDGQVYRAPLSNGFDLNGRRHGRWECERSFYDRHAHDLFPGAL